MAADCCEQMELRIFVLSRQRFFGTATSKTRFSTRNTFPFRALLRPTSGTRYKFVSGAFARCWVLACEIRSRVPGHVRTRPEHQPSLARRRASLDCRRQRRLELLRRLLGTLLLDGGKGRPDRTVPRQSLSNEHGGVLARPHTKKNGIVQRRDRPTGFLEFPSCGTRSRVRGRGNRCCGRRRRKQRRRR